ncbi:MAG: hypothetical protein FDX30_09930 [Chlorobium sp.]|nr:MAG: hypothetical protein FDX30_09930 [Chlorobium sp.]
MPEMLKRAHNNGSIINKVHVWLIKEAAALITAASLLLLCTAKQSAIADSEDRQQPYFKFYNISLNLSTMDLGLNSESMSNPHGQYQGTASWAGGSVTGTNLPLTDYTSISSVTKTNIICWDYFNGANRVSFPQISYVITKPTLNHQSDISSIIRIISISPQITVRSRPQPGGPYWTYSGYADITLDLSGTSRSGTYTGGIITISVTAQ